MSFRFRTPNKHSVLSHVEPSQPKSAEFSASGGAEEELHGQDPDSFRAAQELAGTKRAARSPFRFGRSGTNKRTPENPADAEDRGAGNHEAVEGPVSSPSGGTPHIPPARATPPAPLRIAFDARCWEMSGLGTYTREMLAAFDRLSQKQSGVHGAIAWTILGPESIREQLPASLHIERFVPFDAPVYGMRSLLGYPPLHGVDLFHYPHYNLPFVRAKHRLVSVFDLFHLQFGSFAKRRYQSTMLRRLRWSGAHVLTASAVVAEDLRSQGFNETQLSTIALGPGRSPQRLRAGEPEPPHEPIFSLAGTPIEGPWLLAVGIDQPHKNMEFLLSALGLFYQRRPNAPPFIWLGLRAGEVEARARMIPASVRQRIALVPYSSPEMSEFVLRGAGTLIFPSLAEGFGFPPLEAMSRGIPVVSSRREPMKSLLGDAALYFEPSESASLWRMLDRLIDTPRLQQELHARGLERAALFSWDATGNDTLNLYRKLIDGHGEITGSGATQSPGPGIQDRPKPSAANTPIEFYEDEG